MLAPVTKHLEDVQKEISELLPPDAILCGQSLGNDLRALKVCQLLQPHLCPLLLWCAVSTFTVVGCVHFYCGALCPLLLWCAVSTFTVVH